jgi:hypothetical protein
MLCCVVSPSGRPFRIVVTGGKSAVSVGTKNHTYFSDRDVSRDERRHNGLHILQECSFL